MNLLSKILSRLKLEIAILFVLTIAPLIYLVINVSFFGFKYPYYDQWELVPLITKSFEGSLTIPDLFALHNEHRPFFPRLIMLGTARLTGWNISYELTINIALGIAIFTLIVMQLRKTASITSFYQMRWLIPVISLLAFSLIQWENWAWGWQIQALLSIASSLFGLLILSHYPLTNKKFTSAIVLGIISIFSFASGIAYWFAGLLTLILNHKLQNRGGSALIPGLKPRAFSLKIIIWALIGTIILAMYFINFKRPDNHPAYSSLQTANDTTAYFLAYIGSPLSLQITELAQALGILCLFLAVFLPYLLLKFYNYEIISPYTSIILFSIINGLITGFGRTGFGPIQALTSRYTSFTLLIWTSEIILLGLLFLKLNTLKKKLFKNIAQITIIICLGTILFLSLASTLVGASQLKNKHEELSNLEKDVLGASSQQSFYNIYPIKSTLLERINILKQYKLSIFK